MQSRVVVVAAGAFALAALIASCTHFDSDSATSGGDVPDGSAPSDAPVGDDGGGPPPDGSLDGDAAPTLCDVDKPFLPAEPITELASTGTEAFLRLSQNGLVGYFSAAPAGAGDPSMWSSDLFQATRASVTTPFANVSALGATSSDGSDDSPTVSGNGLTVVFSSTRAGGQGAGDLYLATRASAEENFGAASAIDATNTGVSESSPFLREDGDSLYFVRIASGFLHKLMRATKAGSTFGDPSDVTELNIGDVAYPVVTPDDLVIYYGVASGAKVDIWVASRRELNQPFTGAHAVSELNSMHRSAPSFVSADRCTLYMTTRTYDDAGVEQRRALYVAKRQR